MALVSISEAARLTKKARSTIQAYIKQGKLSKTTDNNTGVVGVDTSELIRVFGELNLNKISKNTLHQSKVFVHDTTYLNTVEIQQIKQENAVLKARLKEKELLLEEKDKRLLLLENKQKEKLPEKKKWWQFLK